MIIDFFGTGIPKRPPEDRVKILESLGEDREQSADYMRFGFDYFDNPDIGVGYGGYSYDGRYKPAVEKIVEHYVLEPGNTVLEVGCAKGFVLVEFFKLGMNVTGLDRSAYAVSEAHPDIANFIQEGDMTALPFADNSFDLVLGKDCLPHVPEDCIEQVLDECLRVSSRGVFFEIGCGTDADSLKRMKEWDQTHQTIRTPDWWEELFANRPGIDRHYKQLL